MPFFMLEFNKQNKICIQNSFFDDQDCYDLRVLEVMKGLWIKKYAKMKNGQLESGDKEERIKKKKNNQVNFSLSFSLNMCINFLFLFFFLFIGRS